MRLTFTWERSERGGRLDVELARERDRGAWHEALLALVASLVQARTAAPAPAASSVPPEAS